MMPKSNALLLVVVGFLGLISCTKTVETTLPNYPVYYEIFFHSSEGKALNTPGGYTYITNPSLVYSNIGYGGLLVIRSTANDNQYFAFDLSCPVEQDANVRLHVNDKLEAECSVCDSKYSILYGAGYPIESSNESPLRSYRTIASDVSVLIMN